MAQDIAEMKQSHAILVDEHETDDGKEIVIDFGVAGSDLVADVVGETVIVIKDGTDEQYEFDLPVEPARTFMQNGVLTLEVKE